MAGVGNEPGGSECPEMGLIGSRRAGMRSPNVSRSAYVSMVPDPANLAARAIPIFPCPAGDLKKTKLGTDFGKVAFPMV